MKIIKIKEYNDLKELKEINEKKFIMNLEECILSQKERVIDFLCGLTFFNGSMKKINRDEYEIHVEV